MLIGLGTLRERIHGVVLNKGEQGHEIDGLVSKLESLLLILMIAPRELNQLFLVPSQDAC